jgi:6-phosphogluconolactonase
MSDIKVKVVPDAVALAEEAAGLVAEAAGKAVAMQGTFSLVMSGGGTPKALYHRLAQEPYRSSIDFSKVEIYFGDERCMPPDHADSNYRMAKETLFDQVPIPPANIHRIRGETEPEQAAKEYGELLKSRFGDGGADLVLLGMGDDGHTASLFPGSTALDETKHRCVALHVEKLNAWRVTMTAPFINRARQVLVLISGAGKAARVAEVLEGPRDPRRLPIQLIQPASGNLIWLMDVAAAGMNEANDATA